MSAKSHIFSPQSSYANGSYTSSQASGMSYLPSYRRDQEYTLPTDRKNYVLNHPVTRMADLHSNEKMIPPLWTKISKTAWEDKARLCSGYGVRMETTKISIDAPPSFLDPHRKALEHYRTTGTKPAPLYSLARVSSANGTRKSNTSENVHVLPGGTELHETTQRFKENFPKNVGRQASRRFPHDKQTYIEYIKPPRNQPPPIRWDSESGRSNGSSSSRY